MPSDVLAVRDSATSAPVMLVVGLDFGTYGTGISYKQINDEGINFCDRWPGRAEPPYPKARTAILYKDSKPYKWGWDAWREYSELDEERKRFGKYCYLMEFKLALDSSSNHKFNPPQGLTAVQVIADFLKLFTDYCVKEVLGDVYSSINLSNSNIQWCLTVPAIWKDSQKDAMREAAYQAGMIPTRYSDRLRIILEPEAAALHAHDAKLLRQRLQPGNTFMMLDAGGGTVDLTVHTIKRGASGQLELEETAPGRGGLCGGTYVDNEFEKWFRSTIGAKVFDRWKWQWPGEHMQVMTSWEVEKRMFKVGGSKPRQALINIPRELLNDIDDAVALRLEEASGYDNRILITQQQMVAFFEPCIQEIVALTKGLAGCCPGGRVDRILLAGGFCKSPYLVARLKELLAGTACRDSSHVHVPDTPESIIMQGAVLAVSGPAIITSRRLRVTYGYGTTWVADSSTPSSTKQWDSERGCYSVRCFVPLALMGQSVKINEAVTKSLCSWSPSSNYFSVTVYTVPSTTARYMDAPGLQALATLNVPVVPGGDDYAQVSFLFGQEEVQITAKDGKATKEPISVRARYCSNSF